MGPAKCHLPTNKTVTTLTNITHYSLTKTGKTIPMPSKNRRLRDLARIEGATVGTCLMSPSYKKDSGNIEELINVIAKGQQTL